MILTQRVAPPSLAYHWARNAAAAAHALRVGPCQVQHLLEGGHDKLCKLIKSSGPSNTTQITRYAEAVDGRGRRACADYEGPRATSARRPSTGKQRRASCACVLAAERRFRTCSASTSLQQAQADGQQG